MRQRVGLHCPQCMGSLTVGTEAKYDEKPACVDCGWELGDPLRHRTVELVRKVLKAKRQKGRKQ